MARQTLNTVAAVNGAPVASYSMGASVTTDAIPIERCEYVAIQFSWAGATSPVGTCTVEGSNDGTNWSTLTLSSTLSVSGASGNNIADFTTGCALIRAVYTRTSGSGNSLTILVRGKGT